MGYAIIKHAFETQAPADFGLHLLNSDSWAAVSFLWHQGSTDYFALSGKVPGHLNHLLSSDLHKKENTPVYLFVLYLNS